MTEEETKKEFFKRLEQNHELAEELFSDELAALAVEEEIESIRKVVKEQNRYWTKDIVVKKSPLSGNGVFAKNDIPVGMIVEFAPVLIFHKDTVSTLNDYYDNHIISDYLFNWNESFVSIVFGYGSIYNHSNNNNITWKMLKKEDELQGAAFYTIKSVKAGEELLSCYNKGNIDFLESGSRIEWSNNQDWK